ncbi:MAG TPA: SMP-30/gluconolactonase/LRE family protein [Xanthobacteraceae bacterium]|nr:SMP-30/gluconolactonase/LRE family protein [Xanthobacteraceae bacterium]
MSRFKIGIAALGATIGILTATSVGAWERGPVDVLAVLPDVTQNVQSSVEGLTVGPDGNIYVPTFGFNTQGSLTGNAVLFVISPSGNIVRKLTIQGSSPHMLGLAFNPVFGNLLVLDFGAGTVLDVNPYSGESTVKAGPIANSGLNALTFDQSGNAYVSDSFNGVIWKVPHSGGATAWASGPLLVPGTGLTPPFGANGVEFNNEHTIMYVADTAFHQIIQIPVNHDGTAGTPSILITGINAPDGIAIDSRDNIWICSNQEDEIVVIDKTGKVIAKLGDFRGIDQNGIAQGLLFPASLAFSKDKQTLYVSNLTLYLPYAGADLAIDSAYTLQVKGYTVSKMPALIPPFPDRFH